MSLPDAVPNNITIKGIDLSNMPKVKIEEVPGKRSYGRRFRVVIDGHNSEEMVMKKMLKQIHKISKVDKALPSEKRLAKLKSVQKLLVELKNANTSANENYDKRGCWYKFRTWFHRLGNRGTHEGNIAKLERKLKEEIKETKALVLKSKPIETFLEDNLNVFQLAKERQGGDLNVDGYDIITTRNPSTILIKDDANELKISFHNGEISEILRVKPQNETLDSVPELFVPILKKAFESTITCASRYGNYEINVVQSSLKEFPVWHLNKLAEKAIKNSLERDSDFSIDHAFSVKFIDDDLRQQEGIDAGGLRRAYVSTLVESIQNQNPLFAECKHGLKCPRIEGTTCTKDEETIYYNLGMLLRCSYNSNASTSGVYFNDILFNTALNFDYSELHTPFAELTRETHLRLALALVDELPTDDESTEKANMLTALDLLDPAKLDRALNQLNDEDEKVQKKALKALSTAALVGMDDDGMEPFLDDMFLNANPEYIKENKGAFIDQLYQSIFSSKSFVGELNGASLGQVLSPIHNVARGMAVNDKAQWNQIKTEGFHNFSLKAQGEIDRQKIHDALPDDAYSVTRELNWLKDWILNDATNEDIQNFLKFASGSASLPEGRRININPCYGEYPIGHSCFYQIDLPQTRNKDKFIENLKVAILTPDFGIG